MADKSKFSNKSINKRNEFTDTTSHLIKAALRDVLKCTTLSSINYNSASKGTIAMIYPEGNDKLTNEQINLIENYIQNRIQDKINIINKTVECYKDSYYFGENTPIEYKSLEVISIGKHLTNTSELQSVTIKITKSKFKKNTKVIEVDYSISNDQNKQITSKVDSCSDDFQSVSTNIINTFIDVFKKNENKEELFKEFQQKLDPILINFQNQCYSNGFNSSQFLSNNSYFKKLN